MNLVRATPLTQVKSGFLSVLFFCEFFLLFASHLICSFFFIFVFRKFSFFGFMKKNINVLIMIKC